MKLPYGISDFQALISKQYFYVDRTHHIRNLEDAGEQLLFLRPRRFGKSLLLSMLENYYDLAKADIFDTLFGSLNIGENPTPLHNQYFVMKWDFSFVSPQGEPEAIQQALYDYINTCIQDFVHYYEAHLNHPVDIKPSNALMSFRSLLSAIHQTPHRLYLFIDEYDNFANELMMGQAHSDVTRYKALLYGEGTLKSLFKAVKSGAGGTGLERVFITGVSPVVLSDITSGYNVADSIHLMQQFNDLCGFTEGEIHIALQQIAKTCGLPAEQADKALSMMRAYYNGYCFAYTAQDRMLNPTLALYFMKRFQQDCSYPREMLDSNLAMDRNKIRYIAQLPNGESLLLRALNDEHPLTIEKLANRFGVEDMLNAPTDTVFMASLLYYFGVLTMGGETVFGEVILTVPNLVVQNLFVNQLQTVFLPDVADQEALKQSATTFYQSGNIAPLCDFIENHTFTVFDNRDYRWSNELTIKTVFMTLLFNDTFYIMDSEQALQRSYADLIMIVRPDMRRYALLDILLEFKLVRLSDTNLSAHEIKALDDDALAALPCVQPKLVQSHAQLDAYHAKLTAKYGDTLRLHCFSVVAIGFERLLCVQYSPNEHSA